MNLINQGVMGPDFTIDSGFAYPAGDQLRILRAEIEDDNRVVALLGQF